MKIAFISYEYPPDTAYGGIATYVYQAAKMMNKSGHHVEVFAGSHDRSGTATEDHIQVHRVHVSGQKDFSKSVAKVFGEQHALTKFDVLEGPDFMADSRDAIRLCPDIPFVCKLHTPSIFLLKLNYYESSFKEKLYLYINALLKGSFPSWTYYPYSMIEYLEILKLNRIEKFHATDADEIVAPSKSIHDKAIKEWDLDGQPTSIVPYPYAPSEKLLNIPCETFSNVVTFLGRLEIRKGVIDLAHAIPKILKRFPETKFMIIGSSEPSPIAKINMQSYLENILKTYAGSVEFVNGIAFDTISDVFSATDICVFPSIWENFPYVCLEAMAAARGIIGSNAGGMAEMLDQGRAGILIPPRNPDSIAEAVIQLLENPMLRIKLGQTARQRVLNEYCAERIAPKQEISYRRAIARKKASYIH